MQLETRDRSKDVEKLRNAEVSVHDDLRRKMSIWIVRVEDTPEVMEILKLLFTPEEAEILSSRAFTAPFQDFVSLEEIARCTFRTEKEVRIIIESLEQKRLIFTCKDQRGDSSYSLLPLGYGSLLFFALAQKPEERGKILSLFEKISSRERSMGSGVADHPWGRIVPVGESMVVINEILPFEAVENLMKNACRIAVLPCSCRTQNPCNHTVETCMGFDEGADYIVSTGFGRYLDLEEALHVLEKTEKAGLVHTAVHTKRGIKFMCNCCICACPVLRRLKDTEYPRMLTSSGLIPKIDCNRCILCMKCIEICPMDALYCVGSDDAKMVALKKNRCVGCGLCSQHCSAGAISMRLGS